jgi:2-dehydropantoate 2-reductase
VGAAGTPKTVVSPLRIAVVGAGGIGGYFGALLARAGYQVQLLARGAHLDAITRQGGLAIRESDGTVSRIEISASNDQGALLGAAYVIVAVKSYSLPEIAPTLRALTAAGAVAVPLLNGVDVADRLVDLGVPRASILGGIAYINVVRSAPGEISHSGNWCRIVVGEYSGQHTDRVTRFAAACRDAGIETQVSEDIRLDHWRKFAFLASGAALCALARRPVGAVRSVPIGLSILERAIREIALVARAAGVSFSDADVELAVGIAKGVPANTKPSFVVDVERGGPNELDALSGTVVRLGQSLGVDTPVHATAVAALSAAAADPAVSA